MKLCTSKMMEDFKSVDLPYELSACILLALDDLKAVEKKEEYVINMDVYHGLRFVLDKDERLIVPTQKVCNVCFAGAVMVNTFQAIYDVNLMPEDFTEYNRRRFRALDSVRVYWIRDALMKIYPNMLSATAQNIEMQVLKGIDVGMSYAKDRIKFKRNMHTIAKRLAKLGY